MFNLKRVTSALIAVSLSFAVAYPAFASTYTVKPGDSLYIVGKLFNTSAATIKSTNKLSENVIYPDQKLIVPADTYFVKSGDSLYKIAKKKSIPLTTLEKANNLSKAKIYPGQELIIPKAAATKTAVTQNQGSGVIKYTSAEVDLLARLITAEADGEPHNAKVGVGAVVVNRVKDERFPNTVSGVINQKDNRFYQFTPVENGLIKKLASPDSIIAAKEALKGIDPTNGAVFYFDDSTTNPWIWSKPLAIRIDKMVYTY
jgi:N-acetylmuramoyl-L-alanine amidase